MPAAGLGVWRTEDAIELYQSAVIQVAVEYPELNIVYHPGHPSLHEPFKQRRETSHAPENLFQASKDVMFIAEALRQQGERVAFHNPSDPDVVFGVYDVGEYWKAQSTGGAYVGEEHIGVTTTAVMNSYGLNRHAYENAQTLTPDVQRKLRGTKFWQKDPSLTSPSRSQQGLFKAKESLLEIFSNLIKAIQSHIYGYGKDKETIRKHRYPASMEDEKGSFGPYEKEGEPLSGDELKKAILDKVEEKIKSCQTPEELESIINTVTSDSCKEYQVIKKPQDWASTKFGFETDSSIALKELISDANAKKNEFLTRYAQESKPSQVRGPIPPG